MDLKTGELFWPRSSSSKNSPRPLRGGDTRAEVAVVGGGLSGALTAYTLVREGLDVIHAR